MSGRRPTNRELKDTMGQIMERLTGLESSYNDVCKENRVLRRKHETLRREHETLRREHETLRREHETLRRTLAYYQNPNTPPSAGSLEYKRKKREVREARGRGDLPPRKKPGGRDGHPGTSRKHSPERTEHHCVDRSRCGCGSEMTVRSETRDIVEIIPARAEETRHVIEYAHCPDCGRTRCADTDLPAEGSYGKGLVGTVADLRAERIPVGKIARILRTHSGVRISKAAVLGILGRLSDALERTAKRIMKSIAGGPRVHVDETQIPNDGRTNWSWVFTADNLIAVTIHRSRGALVVDTHLDGFGGVVISDGFGVYKRFDPGGRHQLCWAHVLRTLEHAASEHGGPVRGLYADVCGLYDLARGACARPSVRLRRAMECALDDIIERYARRGDPGLADAAARLGRAAHGLFAFCEHAGVDPTNNAAERALRDVVVRRKISGQLKGGVDSAKRMSVFLTCVLTWRAQGRSVLEEVMRAV